jgi:hypothetical protein
LSSVNPFHFHSLLFSFLFIFIFTLKLDCLQSAHPFIFIFISFRSFQFHSLYFISDAMTLLIFYLYSFHSSAYILRGLVLEQLFITVNKREITFGF